MHRPRNQLRLPGRVRTWLVAFALVAPPAVIAGAIPAQAAPTGKDYPVTALCGTAPKGHATCFALRRTDVNGGKGLQPNVTVGGFGPADLTAAYGLPAGGGAGQTVAIVDAFDNPNAESDLAVYRAQFGLPPCTTANGCFRKIDQRGGTNYPPSDPGWAGEISLDVQMVSAVAPQAHILLVEADDSFLDNLGTGVDQAVAQGARYVSNSYGTSYTSTPGSGEFSTETTDGDPHYNHPGVAVVASSGDDDFGVTYPAASQFVTAVGGTSLVRDSGSRGFSESVWHNSFGGPGSGCSIFEAKPAWQADGGCAMRAEADVSAVADPATGVAVYNTFQDSGWRIFGGTSASSPIIAAVYAVAGTPAASSYPSSYPYAHANALNDVTSGANGTCNPAYLCTAGTGYDGPTGLGTPHGLVAFSATDRGDIVGTVTDASTGAPVANARISTDQGGALSDAAGHYDLNLPVGTYDLTAAAFGYGSATATGVTVAAGGQVTRDFALTPTGSSTLSGTVTDGSGHNWPLYAKVTVDGAPGGPIFTDPKTGFYSVDLPRGQTFVLHVTPVYTGYQTVDFRVGIGDTDVVHNVAVPVDALACDAPGYTPHNTPGQVETFDGTTAPAGWTVSNATDGGGWVFEDLKPRGNMTGGTGNFAIVDSDFLGSDADQDTTLTAPPFDLSSSGAAVLSFDTDYHGFFNGFGDVDFSLDGGSTWTNVWHHTTGSDEVRGPAHEEVGLPGAGGHPDVRVRFHYAASFAWWWEVDDVAMNTRTCDPTVHGGLVVGQVTDANTGAGITGATVSSVDAPGEGTTTMATPEDPNQKEGFYWFFSTLTGKHAVSYSSAHYVTTTKTVNIRADFATPTNAALDAGRLKVAPAAIDKTVNWQTATTATLTVTNTGTAPATLNISERPEATVPLTAGSAALHTVKGTYSKHAVTAPAAGKGAVAAPRSVTPSAPPWVPFVDYPTTIQDNLVSTLDGKIYAAFGFTTDGDTNNLYTYDSNLGAWQQLASATDTRQHPSGGFINGRLYAVGGWDTGGVPDPKLEIYDPESNSWTTGAPNPKPFSAAGSAVLDGRLYVVGGCTDSACGATDVMAYEAATNTWSQKAPYPEPISWESCGTISGLVYCAGGTTDGPDSVHTYSYDPGSDSWTRLADMPTGLWASGYAVANGMLLVSGGVTAGAGLITNQGYAYDPGTNAWSTLPNSNNTLFRASAACGFYKLGGNPGGLFVPPVADSEQLPGFSDCATANDVSWLSLSATSVTLQPGEQTTVTVTLDSNVPEITQPGAFNASLTYRTDTPYSVPATSVTLNVKPPKTWGKIAGTVTTVDGTPIAGVTVQIDSWANNYTLRTDANGNYQLWLDVRNNPLTVIAAKDGFQPQVKTVKIVRGTTTTVNWALKKAP
jgi:hypothetical protein